MTSLYKLHQDRIRQVTFLFFFANLLILSRMFFIQSFKSEEFRDATHEIGLIERSVRGYRGQIYDRNGEVLAETINKYTFWVNTRKDFDREKIVDLFSSEIQQPYDYYQKLLIQKKKYVKLAHGLLQIQCENILSQVKNIKGLHYDVAISRFYPYNSLASQVVGYVDVDHKGQFGIERQFDPILNGKIMNLIFDRAADGRIRKAFIDKQLEIENGVNIQLTIDIEFQAILTDALKQGLKRSHAVSANGVIINPYTGDILAMASVPDFDPNAYKDYDISTFANRTISESYEPGSTFKLIPMTAILESGLYKANDIFYCEEGEYQIIPSKLIHDHEPHGDLSLSDIFIHSSNIGLTKVVDELGSEHIYDYARKFGFGIKTGVSIPSESPGVLREFREWTRLSGPIVAMGQEISVNTLQLALAYSAAANGGYLPSARIIKYISENGYEEWDYSPKPIRQVMSARTSEQLLEMMEDVVSRGTASKARIPGFRIGGKTGTAEKFIDGQYSKRKFISSFAAIFPIDNPKYVCVVSVDSPSYGYHWGNETAAPIVKEIFERLIINDDLDPARFYHMNQYTNIKQKNNLNDMLATTDITQKVDNRVPNFLGKTLKQSIQEAKQTGIVIEPVGASGKVVWQSVSPGQLIHQGATCQIKLESI